MSFITEVNFVVIILYCII